jgi:hypothetical protein
MLVIDNAYGERDQLTKLDIASRDLLLLNLYEKAFGHAISGFSTCPECSEHCEWETSTTDIKSIARHNVAGGDECMDLTEGDRSIRFRLPNSADLAAAIGLDTESARMLVLRRCVTEATFCGEPEPVNLSDAIMQAISSRMSECAPLAEITLDIKCPACEHGYQACFDIASFLWTKLSLEAKGLIREIHLLAKEYGWSEKDILSMSAVRRNLYLEMVS